jgi:hypothetical protein
MNDTEGRRELGRWLIPPPLTPAETAPAYEPPVPNAALVVGPDDHLVVSLSAQLEYDEVQAFADHLRERFGDRFTIIGGAEQIAVVRGPDCKHCHDDPPVGHTCPACGRPAAAP